MRRWIVTCQLFQVHLADDEADELFYIARNRVGRCTMQERERISGCSHQASVVPSIVRSFRSYVRDDFHCCEKEKVRSKDNR